MKRFLVHTISFIFLIGISVYFVFCQADGYTDTFYVKFTTPKQSSLIIGSSRAAQGIQPEFLAEKLGNINIYNFAFSRVHTPYGEAYFKSIKRKLDKDAKNGIFILEVSPWSISSRTSNPNDSINFLENNSFVDQVKIVNMNPNILYMLNSYQNRNISILQKTKTDVVSFIHDDGWWEVSFNKSDSLSVRKRNLNTYETYKKKINEYSGFSQTRLNYLKQIIEYLKTHGDVYIVRLPVSEWMSKLEDELIPDFDRKMTTLSENYDITFFNHIDNSKNYKFTDGHHLDKKSGEQISKYIADHIINSKTTEF